MGYLDSLKNNIFDIVNDIKKKLNLNTVNNKQFSNKDNKENKDNLDNKENKTTRGRYKMKGINASSAYSKYGKFVRREDIEFINMLPDYKRGWEKLKSGSFKEAAAIFIEFISSDICRYPTVCYSIVLALSLGRSVNEAVSDDEIDFARMGIDLSQLYNTFTYMCYFYSTLGDYYAINENDAKKALNYIDDNDNLKIYDSIKTLKKRDFVTELYFKLAIFYEKNKKIKESLEFYRYLIETGLMPELLTHYDELTQSR